MTSQPQRTKEVYPLDLGDFEAKSQTIHDGRFGTLCVGRLKDPNNKKYTRFGRTPGEDVVVLKKVVDKRSLAREKIAYELLPDNDKLMDIYGQVEIGGETYMVCEFIGQGDFYKWGTAFKSFNETLLRAFMHTSGGYAAMHARNLIHRDIKPENTMLTKSGSVKIVDFGNVFHATREKPEPSNIVGSLDSLAPEQVRKYLSKVGALVHPNQKSQEHTSFMTYGNDKTDVWALGISALKMLKHDDIFKYEEGTDFKISLCNLYEEMYKTDLHSEIDKIKYISSEAKSLLKRILSFIPGERPSMKEIYGDNWTQGKGKGAAVGATASTSQQSSRSTHTTAAAKSQSATTTTTSVVRERSPQRTSTQLHSKPSPAQNKNSASVPQQQKPDPRPTTLTERPKAQEPAKPSTAGTPVSRSKPETAPPSRPSASGSSSTTVNKATTPPSPAKKRSSPTTQPSVTGSNTPPSGPRPAKSSTTTTATSHHSTKTAPGSASTSSTSQHTARAGSASTASKRVSTTESTKSHTAAKKEISNLAAGCQARIVFLFRKSSLTLDLDYYISAPYSVCRYLCARANLLNMRVGCTSALFFTIIAALSSAHGVHAQASAYGQCGGKNWTGATSCVSGYTCQYSNDYYSQCVPGTGSSQSSSSVNVNTKTNNAAATSTASGSLVTTSAKVCPAKSSTATSAQSQTTQASSSVVPSASTSVAASSEVGTTAITTSAAIPTLIATTIATSEPVSSTVTSSGSSSAASSSAKVCPAKTSITSNTVSSAAITSSVVISQISTVASTTQAVVSSVTQTTSASTSTTTSSTGSGSNNLIAAYGQCGGNNWTGSTDCVSGYTCQYSNPYYSQCVPGTGSSTSTKTAKTFGTSSQFTQTSSGLTSTNVAAVTSTSVPATSSVAVVTSSAASSVQSSSSKTSSSGSSTCTAHSKLAKRNFTRKS